MAMFLQKKIRNIEHWKKLDIPDYVPWDRQNLNTICKTCKHSKKERDGYRVGFLLCKKSKPMNLDGCDSYEKKEK